MTYEEAMEFIEHSKQLGSRPGLDTITQLLKRLENPQEQLKIIHIAGTNGKGSTAAYIAAILAEQGYRVGRYNSPAVFSYREMIQISQKAAEGITSEYITEEGISETISAIQQACADMVREGLPHPTSFELETAMAFLYLCRKQVDFAVIEAGMGGRLDATNVITRPLCSVITSVSMDHMQYLGSTLSEIAGEKAGIIKRGVPAVTGNSNPEVISVLGKTCRELETTLTVAMRDTVKDVRYSPEGTSFNYMGEEYVISLLGDYQISNAITAVSSAGILRKAGYDISEAAVKEGLYHASWRGRFEILSREPYFIIDGAHNEDAAVELKKSIELYFAGRELIFIIGVLADKDYRRILKITAPLAGLIITITPPSNRALASERLAAEAKEYCKGTVIDAVTVSEAVSCAYDKAGREAVIIAFGSLTFLSDIATIVRMPG